MKKFSLTRKIGCVLLLKIILLFALWKLCFDHPLSKNDRQAGVNAIFLAPLEKTNDK
ncbi:MAG: hypothetical protein JSS07_06170 [Proteobacteria bacterium]|nr:hypothetical protein [Pseudomonadota bacterium]